MTIFWQIFPWVLVAALAVMLGLRMRRERQLAAQYERRVGEQKQLEETLNRIRQAVESASDAIGIGDMEGTSLYHNRAHIALFGYTVMELNAVEGGGVLFADAVVARAIHAAVRGGYSWAGDTEVRTRDGRLIPCHVRADVIRDEQGRAVGIFGVFTDISERLRARQLVEEQRQRLEVTLQSIGDAVITTDVEGRVVLLNPVAQQLTGLSQKEAAGRPLSSVLPLRDEQTREPCDSAVLELLREKKFNRSTHLYAIGEDSGERLLAENAALIRTADGTVTGAVLALRDVTRERRRAEEAARATKLESLGLMAGSIAHDFGNLLTAMVAQISLAQLEPNISERLKSRLDEAERAVWRARNVTQQLTLFARGGVAKKKVVALEPILREAVGFATGGSPVKVEYVIAPDLWTVEADEGQLVQVVNNLAVNAVQAMPRGGALTVTAKNDQAGADDRSSTSGGRWLRITVVDTGGGIAPEHLSRIFEPFFTTKPRGTGLGLATSYSIVKKHGGQLSVESALGTGTKFCILLPAAEESAPDAEDVPGPGEVIEETPMSIGRPPAPTNPPTPPPKAEPARPAVSALARVLIVDDDPGVREGVAVMLTLLNYEALSAGHKDEAVEKFRSAHESGRPFDAVLLDLNLRGGAGGVEILQALRAVDPAVKAVVVSGDRDDPVMMDFHSAGFAAALAKPFKMAAVDAILRQLLSSRPASASDTSTATT